MVRSVLEALEEDYMNIDMDTWDPEVAKAMPFKPHNQTSNTLIISQAMKDERNKPEVDEILRKYKDEPLLDIFDRIGVAVCKKNIGNILGRCLIQVSCHYLYDTDKVIAHARHYAKLFEEAGISRDRFCIKVPITGPSMVAARVLNSEGIRTLGTSLFGLQQAIAAAQAGCIMVSPYYNECAAHDNLDTLWPGPLDDPATQHPASYRIRHYLEAYQAMYDRGQEVPKVMSASYISANEIVGSAKLGVWAVTLFPTHLKELAETPEDGVVSKGPKVKADDPYKLKSTVNPNYAHMSKLDPLAGEDWDGKLFSIDTDYLANGGAQLEEDIKKDKIVGPRLKDARVLFADAEDEALGWIKARLEAAA